MTFDSIHNYYEKLVLDKIIELNQDSLSNENEDFLNDIACVALNQLPARYVRHNVDMSFYMTINERTQIEKEVTHAVQMAIDYVRKHRGNKRPETISQ